MKYVLKIIFLCVVTSYPSHHFCKVFYFNNNKSTRKNCSKHKQTFKPVSGSDSGRLSGRSKYNSNSSINFCKLLIHYSLPLYHDFIEPVFSHASSASGMVNKMNHILTLSSTGKCPKLATIVYMLLKLNYSSKYFIQNIPEVKNNPHSLFLYESPAKDGLLPFKFFKLSCRNTELNSWLHTSSHALLCLVVSV